MKRISIFLSFIIVSFALHAQKTEIRHFGEFHSVYFFGNINVELIKSDSNYAVLNVGAELELGSVTTELKKSQLFVRNTGIGDEKTLTIKFYYKDIDELIAKAGVEFTSKEVFDAKVFSIRLSKGAIGTIKVRNHQLKAVVIQGSELEISGKADNVNVTTNTGAGFHGFKLIVKDSSWLRSVTGGKIEVTLKGKMEASTNTGGMVYYKGSPTIVSQKTITGGIIEKQK